MNNHRQYHHLRSDSHGGEDENASISSYDFIPAPHNAIASINGPPLHWQEYYAWVQRQQELAAAAARAHHSTLNPAAPSFTPRAQAATPAVPQAAPYQPQMVPRSYVPVAAHPYNNYEGYQQMATGIWTEPPQDYIIRQQIRALLSPPGNAGDAPGRVTVGLPFVVRTLPQGYMVPDASLNRVVLRRNTDLYIRGVEMGMPRSYLQWLAGEDPRRANVYLLSVFAMEEGLQRVERVQRRGQL